MTDAQEFRHSRHMALVSWLAHATPMFWLLTIPALLVVDFLTEGSVGMQVLLSAPFWVAIAATFYADIRHEFQLCARCAALTPLDGEDAAEKVRALLWLCHHRFFVYGAVVLVGIALTVAQQHWVIPEWIDDVADQLWPLTLAVVIHSELVHRVHLPWCMYCDDWGDGGDDEPAPEPVPPSPPVAERVRT